MVRGVRNLHPVELEFSSGLNVISGSNAQGKTSLLEALTLAATTRSFRTEQLRDVIQTGELRASVLARVDESGLRREQRVVLAPGSKIYFLDQKRVQRLVDYATRTPLVVFHPGDLELVSGPATGRRVLLDRLALYLEPQAMEARLSFGRALKERQQLLETNGVRSSALDAYETLMAIHGAVYAKSHEVVAERFGQCVREAFQGLAPPDSELTVEFQPGGTSDPAVFASELLARRPEDLRRGRASFGPQRDDLELSLLGRSARRHASQGQQRLLTLALKIAELTCIEEACQLRPILLLDDVSSELDSERTDSVLQMLRTTECQVFITTTRPELLRPVQPRSDARSDYVVSGGQIRQAERH